MHLLSAIFFNPPSPPKGWMGRHCFIFLYISYVWDHSGQYFFGDLSGANGVSYCFLILPHSSVDWGRCSFSQRVPSLSGHCFFVCISSSSTISSSVFLLRLMTLHRHNVQPVFDFLLHKRWLRGLWLETGFVNRRKTPLFPGAELWVKACNHCMGCGGLSFRVEAMPATPSETRRLCDFYGFWGNMIWF